MFFGFFPFPTTELCFVSATCIGPLGMESGVIGDNQIQASSSFEHASVGPHNARYNMRVIGNLKRQTLSIEI